MDFENYEIIITKVNNIGDEIGEFCLLLCKFVKYIITNIYYIGSKEKLLVDCFICKDTFKMSWCLILRGYGCSICAGQQVGKYNNLEYLEPILSKEWVDSEHNLTPKDVTKFSSERVSWKCSACDNVWETTVSHRTLDETGCPECKNKSKGENKIKEFLLNNNINFIREKRFNNCIYKLTLPFDFYLPDYNILIEYQGKQHYKTSSNFYFGNEEDLKERKIKDQIKKEYALDNGYNYIEIPYWDYKKIDSILMNNL